MFNSIQRDLSLKLHFIFDQFLPPIMRDNRYLMSVPFWLVFGSKYKYYLNFKDMAPGMTEAEFREFYMAVSDTAIDRDTDLNTKSIEKILQNVSGPKVLEAGCGQGYMANLLGAHFEVTAVDIVIPSKVSQKYSRVTFLEASIESLPFDDQSFDTVICTHTLEHVRNFPKAINELRRVGQKLIIVVPRQRPYQYSFDLHLNFFPYLHTFLLAMGKTHRNVHCEDVGGDTFYIEYEPFKGA